MAAFLPFLSSDCPMANSKWVSIQFLAPCDLYFCHVTWPSGLSSQLLHLASLGNETNLNTGACFSFLTALVSSSSIHGLSPFPPHSYGLSVGGGSGMLGGLGWGGAKHYKWGTEGSLGDFMPAHLLLCEPEESLEQCCRQLSAFKKHLVACGQGTGWQLVCPIHVSKMASQASLHFS